MNCRDEWKFDISNSQALLLFGKKYEKPNQLLSKYGVFLLLIIYFRRPEIQQIIIFQWDFISAKYFWTTIN